MDLPHPDRRKNKDRRAKPTSPFTRASLFGSRKTIRRKEDRAVHRFVDRYSFRAILAGGGVVLLSLLDAVLTLKLLDLGAAREVNPVMAFFIRQGPVMFLIAKYIITVVCVTVFLILKNFSTLHGRISVKSLLVFIFIMYACLIVYELSLFYRFKTGMG